MDVKGTPRGVVTTRLQSQKTDELSDDHVVMPSVDNNPGSNSDNSSGGCGEPIEDPADYNHQCYICDKVFSANSNLNRHLRKIHKENVQSPYNNVKCALCDSIYSSSSIYNNHLEQDHKVKIEVEHLTFSDKQSFEDWKHGIESETTSQFIKSRGEKKAKNVNKTYYSCNRSGYYISKARTRKALKKQGSRKINGRCPAAMNVTVNENSSYDVRFVKTHVGHNFELKHLDLSDKDRELIVQKLASGVTKRDIIKQIRSAAEQHHQGNASISPASSASNAATIQPIVITNRNCIPGYDSIEVIQATSEIVITNSNSSSTTTTPIPSATSNSNLNMSPQPISRLHLATTKDIHNILNSKHLDSKKIRHNYDLNNVEAWIKDMKEYNEQSSVLFYKNQNELVERFPKLRGDDFLLIIMKGGQACILKEYGEKCIVIDSTHNVHCEYLHVAYIATVDEQRRGFPVAFMFSNRTDVDILEVFFTILRDRVGIINARMFIADDLHDFYQAWWKVMSMPVHNLLTPWNVFERWSKRFELINNREKLRKLKKQLRTLLTEPETDKFTNSLTQICATHREDPETKQFIEYFEENFSRNPDVWSNCLRKNYGVSNFQLWGLHGKFKSTYKEGKNSKKLCRYISILMNLFEDYQLERLSMLEDESPAKRRTLADRHNKSVETGSLVYEVAVEPVYWLCPTESSSESYYEVKHDDERFSKRSSPSSSSSGPTIRCCDLRCSMCSSCRHDYKCTCLDYVVNFNMCKHIHRICAMCK